jgi:hypothetical protein
VNDAQVARAHALRSRSVHAAWMVADQVLSSGTNLLLLILVLRDSTGPVFGAFSVALIIQGLLLASSRAMIGEVLLLRVRRSPQTSRTDRGIALTLVLVSSTFFALVLAAVGAFMPHPLRGFFLAMAVAVPFVHVQDLQRYFAFATARPRAAVALDLGWVVTQVVMSAIVLMLSRNPVHFLLAWTAGAAISAVAGLVGMRWQPISRGIYQLVREERIRSGAFLSDLALSTGATQAAFLGLSAVLTLAGFGLLRFTLAVTSLTNLLSAVRILMLGYLGRLSAPNRMTWRVLWGGAVGYAVTTVGFVAVLLIIPDDVGTAILGVLWPQAQPLLLLAGIAEALRVAAIPAIDFLKAFAGGSALVVARAVSGLITATGLLVGGAAAGPQGALVALGLANLVALTWWLRAVRSASRRMRTTQVSRGGQPTDSHRRRSSRRLMRR